ncbi:MAG: hypothetical protein MHM6MM_005307 [Cercozoa sp. M6MM]
MQAIRNQVRYKKETFRFGKPEVAKMFGEETETALAVPHEQHRRRQKENRDTDRVFGIKSAKSDITAGSCIHTWAATQAIEKSREQKKKTNFEQLGIDPSQYIFGRPSDAAKEGVKEAMQMPYSEEDDRIPLGRCFPPSNPTVESMVHGAKPEREFKNTGGDVKSCLTFDALKADEGLRSLPTLGTSKFADDVTLQKVKGLAATHMHGLKSADADVTPELEFFRKLESALEKYDDTDTDIEPPSVGQLLHTAGSSQQFNKSRSVEELTDILSKAVGYTPEQINTAISLSPERTLASICEQLRLLDTKAETVT